MYLAACVNGVATGVLGLTLGLVQWCAPGPLQGSTVVALIYEPGAVDRVQPVGTLPAGHNLFLVQSPPGMLYTLGWEGSDVSPDVAQTCLGQVVGGADFATFRAAMAEGFVGGNHFAGFRAALGTPCLNRSLP